MTRDILESHLYCKYKAYLKIIGQQGTKSDYETMLTQLRAQVRLAAIDKIFARCPENDVLQNGTLTTFLLKQGRLFLLDAVLANDLVSLQTVFHLGGYSWTVHSLSCDSSFRADCLAFNIAFFESVLGWMNPFG
jgi:hypothetical protein